MQADSSRLRYRQTCMWRSSALLLATYTCLCGLIQTNYAFRTDALRLQPFKWRTETINTSGLIATQIRSVQVPPLACDQLAWAHRPDHQWMPKPRMIIDHMGVLLYESRRQQTPVDRRCLFLHCPLSRTVKAGELTGGFWTS